MRMRIFFLWGEGLLSGGPTSSGAYYRNFTVIHTVFLHKIFHDLPELTRTIYKQRWTCCRVPVGEKK